MDATHLLEKQFAAQGLQEWSVLTETGHHLHPFHQAIIGEIEIPNVQKVMPFDDGSMWDGLAIHGSNNVLMIL